MTEQPRKKRSSEDRTPETSTSRQSSSQSRVTLRHRPQSSSSRYVIPYDSASTEWNDSHHDYTNNGILAISTTIEDDEIELQPTTDPSVVAGVQQATTTGDHPQEDTDDDADPQQSPQPDESSLHSPAVPSLFDDDDDDDDNSVTSIYTTESEQKPYDERESDQQAVKNLSQKAQYVGKNLKDSKKKKNNKKQRDKKKRSSTADEDENNKQQGKSTTSRRSFVFRRDNKKKEKGDKKNKEDKRQQQQETDKAKESTNNNNNKKEKADANKKSKEEGSDEEGELKKNKDQSNRKDEDDAKKGSNQKVEPKGDTAQPPETTTATTTQVTSSYSKKSNNSNNNNTRPSTIKVYTTRKPVCSLWTWFTEGILHATIKRVTVALSTSAARNPFTYLIVLTLLPLAVLAIGFFTNFTLIVDSDQIYTPMNSFAMQQSDWLVQDSGFNTIRPLLMVLHMHGANVLGKEPLERLFQAIDVVRDTEGYDELCQQGTFYSYDNIHTCRILSATRFWNHNTTLFEEEVTSDAVATQIMSQSTYRPEDGDITPVFHELMLGNYQMGTRSFEYRASTNTATYRNHTEQPILHFVQSYPVRMELPDVGADADDFETRALERLKEMKADWENDDTTQMELDFLSIYAYEIENQRALIRDLPLVLGIILVLVLFTTLVFARPHPVYSRSMLGCASLLAIGISLCLSYGIVWCIGIPFTNIAQILPFMIMGVGLDDTFIITGEYFRTNPNHSVEKRVGTTFKEVGLSITLTTVTTMMAFVLGSLSTIPGVRWLCWYAFAAMGCAYFFQITYFVALLSLDERRLQAYRRNICCWRTVPVDIDDCEAQMGVVISSSLDASSTDNDEDGKNMQTKSAGKSAHFSERFMIWYGTQLMRPWVKALILLMFMGYTGFCSYRMTLLTQEFNVEDYTPADSYLRGTLHSLDSYYSLTKPLEVYFRDVDQSDPDIQQQMRDYVNELAALPQIGEDAPFCWVRDFPTIEERFPQYAGYLQLNLTFSQQLKAALANPTIREIYGEDIVIDEETGGITASRCLLFLRNLDLTVVNDQIDFLESQREVTEHQPINQDLQTWKFFSFDNIFFYWELYAQAVDELIFTIVSGVVAVSAVTFVLIPHWSAIFFVSPGITILYVNFLGTMQWMGLHINSLTYVIICMAIGLLVDFLVHIMLRYYEIDGASREDKAKETLRTMGASMFVGGATTFLGVCPLVLSSTHIFMTVFWSFLAIVTLGFTHGLILLPVVLSLIGPISTNHHTKSTGISGRLASLKKRTDSSSSAGSTSSSGRESKFDDEILRSSTEEELEELNSESSSQQRKEVPFLGPSYELEAIEEGPESTKSRRSIVLAPSDELVHGSPRSMIPVCAENKSASFLRQLAEAYNCAAEFDFYDAVNLDACKKPVLPDTVDMNFCKKPGSR